MDPAALSATLRQAVQGLLAERLPDGHWDGGLSSSALSTAVAAFALQRADAAAQRPVVARALDWLAAHANADGGWGDTPDSPSNLSTTLLVWSAFAAGADTPERRAAEAGALRWVRQRCGAEAPGRIVEAVTALYGGDRTFAAPILCLCALAGRLGPDDVAWPLTPPLPFELALLPRWLFRWLGLRVVSYALPALITMGLLRQRRHPAGGRLRTPCAGLLAPALLARLERLQPPHGGFLEAAPLTGFVVMALAGAGYGAHPVVARGVRFLLDTVRADGSWPIDTNLATWVTTLGVQALAGAGVRDPADPAGAAVAAWLLAQQSRVQHPFTQAAPGGWGWSDRAGAVPDADDTAGALLALHRLARPADETRAAVVAGTRWLLDMQNGDGGWPTFCKGWGKLPFDRSCPDITAHALRALDAWYDALEPAAQARTDAAMAAGMRYLEQTRRDDGAWEPLWFGNQAAPGGVNAVYGTARVVLALADISPGRLPARDALQEEGVRWLEEAQGADGGWGGAPGCAPSIEETAVAVEALAAAGAAAPAWRGAAWLVDRTGGGEAFPAAPIGLYFASLWYAERLYPRLFTIAALGRVARSDGGSGDRT